MEKHHVTENELITMINQKDEAVFDILYEKYWQTLLKFAGNYLTDKDTCKEIVQELFITLHSKRSLIIINSSLSSYLHISLRNRILNHIRDQSLYKRHITCASKITVAMAARNDVEQFMNLAELKKDISDCLNIMPEKYKQVYVLYIQYEFTPAKIAAILNRPLSTVEKQFRKAAYRLRDYLSDHICA